MSIQITLTTYCLDLDNLLRSLFCGTDRFHGFCSKSLEQAESSSFCVWLSSIHRNSRICLSFSHKIWFGYWKTHTFGFKVTFCNNSLSSLHQCGFLGQKALEWSKHIKKPRNFSDEGGHRVFQGSFLLKQWGRAVLDWMFARNFWHLLDFIHQSLIRSAWFCWGIRWFDTFGDVHTNCTMCTYKSEYR